MPGSVKKGFEDGTYKLSEVYVCERKERMVVMRRMYSAIDNDSYNDSDDVIMAIMMVTRMMIMIMMMMMMMMLMMMLMMMINSLHPTVHSGLDGSLQPQRQHLEPHRDQL